MPDMLHGLLYEESSLWTFILVTVVLGGAGAWMTGRACAQTWRPYFVLVFYLAILAIGVRFIHFSLFEGTFLSAQYYLVDFLVVQLIGGLAYRVTRVTQMAAKYSWLFEKTGPFGWRAKREAR